MNEPMLLFASLRKGGSQQSKKVDCEDFQVRNEAGKNQSLSQRALIWFGQKTHTEQVAQTNQENSHRKPVRNNFK